MHSTSRRTLMSTAALAATAIAATGTAKAATGKLRAVFQVSDAEPDKWNLTLNNVRNAQQELADAMSEIEIVVYGPGIGMLKAGSTVAARISEALKHGVKVVACENTMKGQKLTSKDMLTDIGYVPAGVVELIRKQHEGWAYIRA